ncbi:MAG: hypothetical protein NTZ43_15440 [Gemmatimonadetes bacterium]|nr:hypothetical protein [Gemmatimonadota bacterium]
MRTVSRIALGVLLAAVATRPVGAQADLIGTDHVFQLFTSKQARLASREMGAVSLDFRKELGRCKDEVIGGRMMQTEPKIDALGAKLAAATPPSAASLEKEFAEYDHLLAEHHHQLAANGWAKPRFTKMERVAEDIDRAAQYVARAARWEKQKLSAESQKAVDDALAVAKKLGADPANPPAETAAVIEALGAVVKKSSGAAPGSAMP